VKFGSGGVVVIGA